MDEYISKEKAIKELREIYEYEYPTASGDFDEYASHDVPNVLRNIPSADVQPVKHGRWESPVSVGNGIKFCSVCRNEAYWDTDYGQQLFDYCPYCGARMDLKDGDTDA